MPPSGVALHAAKDCVWLAFCADPPSNLLQPQWKEGRLEEVHKSMHEEWTIKEGSISETFFIGAHIAPPWRVFTCPFPEEIPGSGVAGQMDFPKTIPPDPKFRDCMMGI